MASKKGTNTNFETDKGEEKSRLHFLNSADWREIGKAGQSVGFGHNEFTISSW